MEHRRVVSWDNHTEDTIVFGVPLEITDDQPIKDVLMQVMTHLDISESNFKIISMSELPYGSYLFVLQGVEEMKDEISVWIVGDRDRRGDG